MRDRNRDQSNSAEQNKYKIGMSAAVGFPVYSKIGSAALTHPKKKIMKSAELTMYNIFRPRMHLGNDGCSGAGNIITTTSTALTLELCTTLDGHGISMQCLKTSGTVGSEFGGFSSFSSKTFEEILGNIDTAEDRVTSLATFVSTLLGTGIICLANDAISQMFCVISGSSGDVIIGLPADFPNVAGGTSTPFNGAVNTYLYEKSLVAEVCVSGESAEGFAGPPTEVTVELLFVGDSSTPST